MARAASASVIRQLETLFEGGSIAGLSDRQLLERYAADPRSLAGEAAFAALVARHGPMVLGVCRQLLADQHLAEDAFQAVFFVLARKASSIRDPGLLGPWLYGIALRTAARARHRVTRTRQIEEQASIRQDAFAGPRAEDVLLAHEQAERLHREIDRLPVPFRSAVVLCYFEGMTLDEAARRLRCPAGTLRSRLARAREKLRINLTRGGMGVPGAELGALLTTRAVSASVPPLLCDSTARAAIAFTARHGAGGALSASAAKLAREALRAMLLSKIKLTVVCLLLLVPAATGARWAMMRDKPEQGSKPGAKIAVPTAAPPRSTSPPDRPGPGRMFVTGRVLNPQGNPVSNASTMVYAALKFAGRGYGHAEMWPSALGHAQSDGSGRFRLDAPRVSSSRNYEFGAVAVAPGYGAGWTALDPDADQPAGDITLRPEQVIEGRFFDAQGRPAAGVQVSVEHMGSIVHGDRFMVLLGRDGPYFVAEQTSNLPAWARSTISDANGRFTIQGVGKGVRLGLVIDDRRFAKLEVDVDTDAPSGIKTVTFALEPPRVITGRVIDADTSKPVPHSFVSIESNVEGGTTYWEGDIAVDAEGRFRVNPRPARRYILSAFPPERSPYLNVGRNFDWRKGAVEHSADLALPRGVPVRGKVIEEGTNKPVAGARIGYLSNPDQDERTGAWNTRAVTAADGSFEFGVLPNPGYLTVLGPDEDFVLHELGQRLALAGQPGGRRLYAHAFRTLDPKSDGATHGVTIALRPSAAVNCQVVGPTGRPVEGALAISRVILQPLPTAFLFWTAISRSTVRDGQFAVHGLADDANVPVYFLDAENNLGATVDLSGKLARGGPVMVRLQPCGSARARLVDTNGQPVARSRDDRGSQMTMMVVTSGPHWYHPSEADKSQLAADQDLLTRFDPIHYPDGLVSDAQGHLTLQALIPGATYRIYDETRGESKGPQLRKEFIAKSGETLDLGDILVEKPPPGL